MRFLVFADLHAHISEERCFSNPEISLQAYRVDLFFKDLDRIFKEQGCDGLIDLGDTTHDRSAIPIPVIDQILTGFSKYAGRTNYKLVGNHEQFLRNAEISSAKLYDSVFEVVRQRHSVTIGNAILVFASYPAKMEDLNSWLTMMAHKSRKQPTILCGHFPVTSAIMHGSPVLMGIEKTTIEPYTMALLGHIHQPQPLNDQVFYVGSPFQQNWGESGEDKFTAILDTDKLTLEWVPMTGYPRYIKATLDEFRTNFDEHSEDRWQVDLQSDIETEQFLNNPWSHRAKSTSAYTQVQQVQLENDESNDWSFENSLACWVRTVPYANSDIKIEDVIETGRQLAGCRTGS